MRGYLKIYTIAGLVAMCVSPSAMAQNGLIADAGVGVFGIDLPGVQFTLIEDNGFNPTSKMTNHDGEMSGVKYDGSFAYPLMGTAMGTVYLGVTGFVAGADGGQHTTCNGISGAVRCGWLSPFNPTTVVGFGSGDDISVQAERDVAYYGGAIELTLRRSAKLSVVAGVDFRRLNQDLQIDGFEVQTPANLFTYTETLDTKYSGAFVGLAGTIDLGGGFYASGRGRIGAYRAKAEFSGSYQAVGPGAATASGSRSASKTTYIASLRGEVGLKLTRVAVSAFGEVERIGWVPAMQYQDANPFTSSLVATTAINDDRSSLNYTFGGRLKFDLN